MAIVAIMVIMVIMVIMFIMIIIKLTFDSGVFSTATLPRLIKHSGRHPRVHEVVPALNDHDHDHDSHNHHHDNHHHHHHHHLCAVPTAV